jgi:hypothetical protein
LVGGLVGFLFSVTVYPCFLVGCCFVVWFACCCGWALVCGWLGCLFVVLPFVVAFGWGCCLSCLLVLVGVIGGLLFGIVIVVYVGFWLFGVLRWV